MASTFRLQIVTPDAKSFLGEVEMVVLPGMSGEFGVMAGHEPLMTTLLPGELQVTKDGKTFDVVIGAGFADVNGQRVCVFTDVAVRSDQAEAAAVQAARLRAAQERETLLASLSSHG